MRWRFRATVLYENHRYQIKEYGPHNLVLACVADALGQDPFLLKRHLEGIPRHGNANLLRDCQQDIENISAQSVVAVFDDDRVRQLLKLPHSATFAEVEQKIKEGCRVPERLHVILLEQNLETRSCPIWPTIPASALSVSASSRASLH